jgi:hypothetical protein
LHRLIFVLLAALGACHALATEPVLRQPVTDVFAVTGVRIVVAPGEVIDSGTVVVRDGIIEAVGADLDIPADATVYEYDADEAELTLYPGLIDAYVPVAFASDKDDKDDDEEPVVHRLGQYPHPLITPERRMSSRHWPSDRVNTLREAGFTTAVLAPEDGLVRGRSALVNLGEGGYGANVIRPELFQHISLQARLSGRGFPSSLMGATALLRQAFLDAQWQASARSVWQDNPRQRRPDFLEGIEPLEAVIAGDVPVVFEASDMLDSLRIAAIVEEFGLSAWMVGHGREYQRLDSLAATGIGQILPLDFPSAPDVDEDAEREASLQELRQWHLAPENPARVVDSGLSMLLTSHPHGSPANLFEHLEKAIKRGLDPDRALAALTTGPAELLGLDGRAGRIRAGYMANFLLVEDELFVASPSIREVWVDGRRHLLREMEPPEVEPAGQWDVELIVAGMGSIDATLTLRGDAPVLSGSMEIMGTRLPLSEARVSGTRLDIRIDGSRLGMPGSFTMYMDIEGDRGRGAGSSPQGDFNVRGRRTGDPDQEDSA